MLPLIFVAVLLFGSGADALIADTLAVDDQAFCQQAVDSVNANPRAKAAGYSAIGCFQLGASQNSFGAYSDLPVTADAP